MYSQAVFEIKVLFCAPYGRTGSYNMHPAACSCTPLVYSHNISLKKRAHTGRTAQKNVRPSTEMCAPGAVCTLNFEQCQGLEQELVELPIYVYTNLKMYVIIFTYSLYHVTYIQGLKLKVHPAPIAHPFLWLPGWTTFGGYVFRGCLQ